MSDILSIGASGVRAYQGALTTVSENIANSGVSGYSRRTVDLKEVVAAGGLTAGKVRTGMGAAFAGVARQTDPYKAAAARSAEADLARTESSVEWMDRIEGALTGAQLGARVTGLFTAARTLAADPSSLAARAAMLEAGESAAGAFRATGDALKRTEIDLDASAEEAVAELGGIGGQLAKINARIVRAEPGSAAYAGLADERDRLLERMSALSDVAVTTDDAGRATVRLGGAGGPLFVSGVEAGRIAYARGTDGAVAFAVFRGGQPSVLQPNGGALGGIADGAARIADARAELDRLATGFTTAVNQVQAQGRDLDGQAGEPMFAVGGEPTDIGLALTDPRGIAAASAGGGQRDASNLDALEAARDSGGFESGLAGLAAANAAALQQRKIVGEAQVSIRDNAAAARDVVSAVDLDNEAVELMRFQQAYQASSRVIQVARETFQSILEVR